MGAVFICRQALEDSVLGNLALARCFARKGQRVSVVFTGEALHAMDTGTFEWSRNFRSRESQARVIVGAEEQGLALAHRELDNRWSDLRALVASFEHEPNMRLLACPLWSALLGIEGNIGPLQSIDDDELVELLSRSETIVGGY